MSGCATESVRCRRNAASVSSLERRSRLTLDLTNLVRGEAIGRVGSQSVVRFRVPALPNVTAVTAAELDVLIEPVTRAREEIERLLRQSPEPQGSDPLTVLPDLGRVQEGQHDW